MRSVCQKSIALSSKRLWKQWSLCFSVMRFWCGLKCLSRRCSTSWKLSLKPRKFGFACYISGCVLASHWRVCGKLLMVVKTRSMRKLFNCSGYSSSSSISRGWCCLFGWYRVDVLLSGCLVIGFNGPVSNSERVVKRAPFTMSQLVPRRPGGPWVKAEVPSSRLNVSRRSSPMRLQSIFDCFVRGLPAALICRSISSDGLSTLELVAALPTCSISWLPKLGFRQPSCYCLFV